MYVDNQELQDHVIYPNILDIEEYHQNLMLQPLEILNFNLKQKYTNKFIVIKSDIKIKLYKEQKENDYSS